MIIDLTEWGEYRLVQDGKYVKTLHIKDRIEPDAGIPILVTDDIEPGEAWVVSPNSPHVIQVKVKGI